MRNKFDTMNIDFGGDPTKEGSHIPKTDNTGGFKELDNDIKSKSFEEVVEEMGFSVEEKGVGEFAAGTVLGGIAGYMLGRPKENSGDEIGRREPKLGSSAPVKVGTPKLGSPKKVSIPKPSSDKKYKGFEVEEKAINPSKAAKAAEKLWDIRRGAGLRSEKYSDAYNKVIGLPDSPIKKYAERQTYGRAAQMGAKEVRYHNLAQDMKKAAESGKVKLRPDVGVANELTIPATPVHAPEDRERYFYRKGFEVEEKDWAGVVGRAIDKYDELKKKVNLGKRAYQLRKDAGQGSGEAIRGVIEDARSMNAPKPPTIATPTTPEAKPFDYKKAAKIGGVAAGGVAAGKLMTPAKEKENTIVYTDYRNKGLDVEEKAFISSNPIKKVLRGVKRTGPTKLKNEVDRLKQEMTFMKDEYGHTHYHDPNTREVRLMRDAKGDKPYEFPGESEWKGYLPKDGEEKGLDVEEKGIVGNIGKKIKNIVSGGDTGNFVTSPINTDRLKEIRRLAKIDARNALVSRKGFEIEDKGRGCATFRKGPEIKCSFTKNIKQKAPEEEKMSTAKKVGIGLGGAALAGGGILLGRKIKRAVKTSEGMLKNVSGMVDQTHDQAKNLYNQVKNDEYILRNTRSKIEGIKRDNSNARRLDDLDKEIKALEEKRGK